MKKIAVVFALAGLGLAQGGVAWGAGSGGVLAPAVRPGWTPQLMLGDPAGCLEPGAGEVGGDAISGVQPSLGCTGLQPSGGSIRPQLNINRFANDGVRLTTTEMNPRYFMNVAPGLALGLGPGLGYVQTQTDAGKGPDLWAVQIGADLDYRQGPLFLGVGTRYQWTENGRIGASSIGADNWLTTLKLGVKF
jgi:hypothetical protein